MPKTPNYGFERAERERQKAAKLAAKLEAKQKANDSAGDRPSAAKPDSGSTGD